MGADGEPRVREYMTSDVATVSPDDTVEVVAHRIAESDEYSGFPVCEGRRVEGFVSARDLLLAEDHEPMFRVMSDDILVAHPEMGVQDAGRVILRSGIQKLPVVDDAGHLVGIISNADVIRSHIERATPNKVDKLTRTLESIHDVSARDERREVVIDELVPTQGTVYADELEGRTYELKRGLAEPLVVIDNGGLQPPDQVTVTEFADGEGSEQTRELLLADGHHRVKAAEQLGVEEMDAYVIVLGDPVDLGMARTADDADLTSISDIEVVDYARHPLVETTERLQGEDE
ncbi:CBS domain-containing protein [Halomicrobium sp. LC1Hm]|uniref:CBS domain-containing protein n=1 Tax=Halomicrobium sp. LC1Hm TaxID=2610902 RepID=UPI00129840E3|nr:CBS domain-containing protein [Halomicrobium sp. LC1Hm]QGA82709.1 CBS domain containing protein [Halomicrobium sp. LC1Hm]